MGYLRKVAITEDEFRQGLRRWASGVTVVTSAADGQMHGMTVSAFASVSASPPIVLVCANQSSRTHGFIERSRRFAVNILAQDQADVSNHFASSETEADRLKGIDWQQGDTGLPLIDGALAQLECTVHEARAMGTHTIYLGVVEHLHYRDGEPLVYFQGAYRG